MYHQLVTDYVDTLIAAKRFADAHAQLDEVFVLEQANQSPTLPASQTARAELALAEGKWADADEFAALAIASYETAGGKNNPTLWRPLTALARAASRSARPATRSRSSIARSRSASSRRSPSDLAPTKALVPPQVASDHRSAPAR